MTSPQTTSQATELADAMESRHGDDHNGNRAYLLTREQRDLIIAALRAASRQSDAPEEITSAEMDAIEAAAIADKPVQSMDIWQAYAAAQDEIAALRRERAAVIEVRQTAFAECAAIARRYDDCGALFVADKIEEAALQPATPATGGQHG